MTDLNILLAFGAGLLSFISPCCLPLYPAFLSYITGISVQELKEENAMLRKTALLHTTFFLIGFSIIFIFLGLSTTIIGDLFVQYQTLLRQIGAIVIIFFGLVVMGFITPTFLMKDKKVRFQSRPTGYLGSVLIGIGFAAGWTPCMGPILAGVIALGVSNPAASMTYMVAYVLGFAVPFFVLSFFLDKLKVIKKFNRQFMLVGGTLMVVMGILLYFDWLTQLTSFLTNRVFGGFKGF
ncbi:MULTISPECIES: cytochrome c biogenesis CcdA family protein [Fictibacillus]|jgi:cytochrome c-type biogenesis protein|uniref:cytochrome c biogenesis CcdA family protein n=1 Tax=Fictibacillus TaxID=1329200 RepID=UPI0018CD1BD7|nr:MULTISPECIES: cytochrome c biogenesis protein CcdA [unclassified Fictibacillus]MBH0156017.1 sulfite exporter TauE/SafE family protein [Fictibacillus sp. 5RED26]MBH0160872.1 sulfite exporter TauE/SafE family protein [Fictibacillus sp. 26RED30]MBH0165764.1 sulfite exporter TauE/SafE family protein [Fictibacillus sp. 7GRE50]